MDYDFFNNLLDYDEDDLDSDLHCVSNMNAKPEEMEAAAEAVDEVRDHEDSTANQPTNKLELEFFFSRPGQMECPIKECKTLSLFSSRAKYLRHWTERHVPTSLKYHCSAPNCSITCRRRYDMKIHMRDVHLVQDQLLVEDMVSRCYKSVMQNKGFIDPGIFIYKGRTLKDSTVKPKSSKSSASSTKPSVSKSSVHTSTASSSSSVPPPKPTISVPAPDPSTIISTVSVPITDTYPDDPDFTVRIPAKAPLTQPPSHHKLSLEDYKLRKHTEASPLDVCQVDYSRSFGITATVEAECQTLCLERPAVVLPPIPNHKEELEAHVRWLCVNIDSFTRQRDAAVKLLEELRRDGIRLEKEKQQRRELESENRRLKRELIELKWRDKHLFPEQ